MSRIYKSIVSVVLVVSMLLGMALPIFAVKGELYISDLRLVYADTYREARDILDKSEFFSYSLLGENLNLDSDEIGVWLAYKTTYDIEDAITDISVMQMGGGYKEGNYQQMIKESYDEYVAMGEIYLDAIEYFAMAYDADDFLAQSAYRQLNFYTVETQKDIGLAVPPFEGELLGDILYEGIDESELATMFLQGNSYALKNIRALIAMGVSYNEDGKTYFQKVAEAAEEMTADPTTFAGGDYDDLTEMLVLSMACIRDVLNELALVESELDYSDEEFTDDEIRYIEIKAIADEMRDTAYLNGQTLYQFFMEYVDNTDDRTSLYPLIAALNEGQEAMTKVAHYYDVLRYSFAVVDEEIIEEELEELEEIYGDNPFNIYTGVDRSIYNGTFALTTAADRADVYSQIDMLEDFLGTEERENAVDLSIATGISGLLVLGGACLLRSNEVSTHDTLRMLYKEKMANAGNDLAGVNLPHADLAHPNWNTYGDAIDDLFYDAYLRFQGGSYVDVTQFTFVEKVNYLQLHKVRDDAIRNAVKYIQAEKGKIAPVSSSAPLSLTTGIFFVAGGVMMIYSVCNILATVYSYYNPDYEDIPLSMVDLVETQDGDRYIKYDVVYEAEARKKGGYSAGDLNAFEGQRWNALYYTKSYEAGKPLLASDLTVSNSSNKPKDGYAPVHLFGEKVCYNLNKYNFEGDTCIYLSVKQSENQKAAVADVPDVVGSMFGAGYLALAGGVGVAVGVGGSLATVGLTKKRKKKE